MALISHDFQKMAWIGRISRDLAAACLDSWLKQTKIPTHNVRQPVKTGTPHTLNGDISIAEG